MTRTRLVSKGAPALPPVVAQPESDGAIVVTFADARAVTAAIAHHRLHNLKNSKSGKMLRLNNEYYADKHIRAFVATFRRAQKMRDCAFLFAGEGAAADVTRILRDFGDDTTKRSFRSSGKGLRADILVTFRPTGVGEFSHAEDKFVAGAFRHTVDLARLSGMKEAAVAALLERMFWSDINPKLENPLLSPDEIAAHNVIAWSGGTLDDLTSLMRLIILTEPCIGLLPRNRDGHVALQICAKSEPDVNSRYYHSLRVEKILEILFESVEPRGLRYNGSTDKLFRHDFRQEPCPLTFEIADILDNATARERFGAMRTLTEWIVAHGKEPADYGLFADAVS